MENFLSASQFCCLVFLKVAIGLFIVYLMYKFAVRNPTDYDTLYRRRMRYVYGFLCTALALGFLFLAFRRPFSYSLPYYYLSTYGTYTPDEVALQYGITSNMVIRAPGIKCVWGRMTFDQWSISANISSAIALTALAVYAFNMKRSSVKWFAKLRKGIGYVMLLTFPAQIEGLHYFDFYEFVPLVVYLLVVYLFVRSYKLDFKTASKPIESQHKNVQEFVAERPEVVVENEEKEGEKSMRVENNEIIEDDKHTTLGDTFVIVKTKIYYFCKTILSKLHQKSTNTDTQKLKVKKSSKFCSRLHSNWKKIIKSIIGALVTIAAIVGMCLLYDYYYHKYLPEKHYKEEIEKVINAINSPSEEAKRFYYGNILSKYPRWTDIEDPKYIVDFQNGICPIELQIYREDAFQWFESKAYGGDSLYQMCLASFYDQGEEAYYVGQNKKRAAYWYERSAMNGFVSAYSFIGICYRDGEGVSKDLRKALEWFQKGSEANDSRCQYFLADMYHKGVYIRDGQHFERIRVYDLDRRSFLDPRTYERVTQGWDPYKQDYYTVYKYLVDDYKCILSPDIEKAKELWRKSAGQGYYPAKEELEQIY